MSKSWINKAGKIAPVFGISNLRRTKTLAVALGPSPLCRGAAGSKKEEVGPTFTLPESAGGKRPRRRQQEGTCSAGAKGYGGEKEAIVSEEEAGRGPGSAVPGARVLLGTVPLQTHGAAGAF